MHTFRLGIPAFLFALLLLVSAARPAQAAFGQMVMLRGTAVVFRGGLEIHVNDRIDLEDGDRIRTAKASKAHIRLTDKLKGGEAIVTAETSFRVNELRQGRKASPFQLAFGAIRSRIASFFGKTAFMRTSTATIGVKGTDFIVYVKRKNASEFIGVEGLIEAASVTRPDYAIRIGKRQWGEIVEGQKPKPPVRVPDPTWEAALREFSFPQG